MFNKIKQNIPFAAVNEGMQCGITEEAKVKSRVRLPALPGDFMDKRCTERCCWQGSCWGGAACPQSWQCEGRDRKHIFKSSSSVRGVAVGSLMSGPPRCSMSSFLRQLPLPSL